MPRRSNSFRSRALSLTPLIDVIFLLLLFFMLTSTFTRFAEVPLIQAAAGPAAEEGGTKQRLFLRLTDTGLMANGQAVPEPIGPSMAAALDGEDAIGLLSVTPDVTSQQFIETLQALQGVPTLTVAVLR